MCTLITVQWYVDSDSHKSGLKSLLGTPKGILFGTLKDSIVHTTIINGTP